MAGINFNLPLEVGCTEPEAVFDCNGDYMACFSDEGKALYVIASVNNASTLADALESVLGVIKNMHYTKWLEDDDDESVVFEESSSYLKMVKCFGDEIAALSAYRGAK